MRGCIKYDRAIFGCAIIIGSGPYYRDNPAMKINFATAQRKVIYIRLFPSNVQRTLPGRLKKLAFVSIIVFIVC